MIAFIESYYNKVPFSQKQKKLSFVYLKSKSKNITIINDSFLNAQYYIEIFKIIRPDIYKVEVGPFGPHTQ